MSVQQSNVIRPPGALPDFLEWRDEEIFVRGHRITLDEICHCYAEGFSAEMLQGEFPTLSLLLIQKAIVFYLENRAAVDEHLAAARAARDRNYESWRQAGPATPDAAELRRRLEAGEKGRKEASS